MKSRSKFLQPIRVVLAAIIAALILVPKRAEAATRAAASCSTSAVQAAVDLAADGDIVTVPRCPDPLDPANTSKSAIVDWSSGVIVSGKAIKIQGAGRNLTKLRLAAPGHFLFHIPSGNTKPVQITGFTFTVTPAYSCDSGTAPYDCSAIRIAGGNQFIVYDNLFDGIHGGVPVAIYAIKGTYGLIHSNTFNNCYVSVYPFGNNDATWSQPITLGDEKAVYIEDNTITHTTNEHCTALEAEEAAQYVFRYNTVSGCSGAGSHSPCQSGGRGTRRMEVYHNTIIQSGQNSWAAIYVMGGTGVIFQNEIRGAWERPILFDYKRSCESAGCLSPYDAACNGGAGIDGNRTTDYAGQPVAKNGWPCLDQIGLGTNQSRDSFYEWNNCTGDSPCPSDTVVCSSCSGAGALEVDPIVKSDACPLLADQIKDGRDYFKDTIRPGYVPYPYPHPLRSGGGASPSAPTNLQLSAQ